MCYYLQSTTSSLVHRPGMQSSFTEGVPGSGWLLGWHGCRTRQAALIRAILSACEVGGRAAGQPVLLDRWATFAAVDRQHQLVILMQQLHTAFSHGHATGLCRIVHSAAARLGCSPL